MHTKQIYYLDPYKKELEAKIISIDKTPLIVNIVLDQTIFYPEGGGQPCDTGIFKNKSAEAKIEYVRTTNGEIIHQTKTDTLSKNDVVSLRIDWNSRYRYMRIHSAGHLLHDILMDINPQLVPQKGSHGKKAYLEYLGKINLNQKTLIEEKVNETLQKDLPIVTKEADIIEIQKECRFVPDNLPKDKKLRMIKIGDFPGMPDGGVHVKSTKEIGKIWVANISQQDNNTLVRYGIAD